MKVNSTYLDKLKGRLSGFLRESHAILRTMISSTPPGGRRLLLIYDLATQPFSIGDILVVHEASLVMREKYGVNLVDFALVYDPQSPTCVDPVFASITPENVMYHLASVLPVAQANQHLGSLFVFNSHAHLQRFVRDNADLYQIWPNWPVESEYLYYPIMNDVLYNYYNEHKRIPRLSCRPFLVNWAKTFYDEHAASYVPITVQIRNNPLISTVRNSRLDCWLEFFRYCEDRYPVKFIIVCALSEVDERLRHCRNVIVAKDHGTTIEQDLALISTAAIHTGASSGPGILAVFNTRPYLMFSTTTIPHLYRGLIEEDGFLRFCFSHPLQRHSAGPETTDLLIKEFARMWATIDVDDWQVSEDGEGNMQKEALTWLR